VLVRTYVWTGERSKMRRQAVIAALLVVGVAVVLGATVFRTDIAQATGLAQSVTVTNTASNPVPVNVTNTSVPVHEQGTANVNVTGTPKVNALDAGELYQQRVDAQLCNGCFNGSASFTVPAGKRFVAEFISVQVILPPGQAANAYYNADTGATGGFVPLESQGIQEGQNAIFIGDGPILDYRDGGSDFTVSVSRASTSSVSASGDASLSAFVSGYLVPMP
jgi:hypothetical protein